jgi:hypothetical protein
LRPPPGTPSDIPQHLDTISKKDTVDRIKNDNKQDNFKKMTKQMILNMVKID